MELNKGHVAFSVACFVAGAIIGAGLRNCSVKPSNPPADPVVIHDTVEVSSKADIDAHTKQKYVIKHDTLWLPKPEIHCDSTDSVCDRRMIDSIPVDIPITNYEYRDTFTTDSSRVELGVRFSGWHAQIDGIDIKSQYTVQPRTIMKKKGWGQFVGIGIGVGYGASFVGNPSGVGSVVYAVPEIGVHITYGWGYHW